MSIDWLVMGFTGGMPLYGIHDKLFPDKIATRIWEFLKAMCESMLWADVDYVIEGEAVLPDLVSKFLEEYPGKIRICFVGYADIDVDQKLADIKIYNDGERDWLTKESDDYIYRHIENMVAHSRAIKNECAKYEMRYFDTSENFLSSIENATRYLIDERNI